MSPESGVGSSVVVMTGTPLVAKGVVVFRRSIVIALLAAGVAVSTAVPALAAHDHYVVTPNGDCHQVAQGQTSIADPDHGGYHRFHVNVHIGATGAENRVLGDGNARVDVYKGTDAPESCF